MHPGCSLRGVAVERTVTRFKVFNLRALRRALDEHNASCPIPARGFLLHPTDHALMGWETLWGLPLTPDDRVTVKSFRLECDGSAWGVELALCPKPAD